MKQRDVFIVSQTGVNPVYNKWAKEALQEWFTMFPDYKDRYPITDLGAWKDRKHEVDKYEYATLSKNEKEQCLPVSGGKYLRPYKSVDWFVGNAVLNGLNRGFRNNEICSDEFISQLNQDPTRSNFPQLNISLVQNSLKPNNNPGSPGFIYGHSSRGVGTVISVGKLSEMPLKQREMFFKALVMHEFTHVCSVREGHCLNKDCIMEDWNTDIVKAWQKNKADNKPPLCAECWASCGAFFAHDCREQQKLNNYINLYKSVCNTSRGW